MALLDRTPAAAVFDCDGLLMDTEPCWTVAETAVFSRHGLPFGPDQKELVLGRSLLDTALRRGGLDDRVVVTVAADEVTAPKPAPDLYVVACERLGGDPHDAVAFEDSPTGLYSARAAGLATVGVPSGTTTDLDADLVVGSLEDADLVRWVEGWTGHRALP